MSSYLGGLKDRLHSKGVWENLTLLAVQHDFKNYVSRWKRAVKAGECPQEAFYRVFLGEEYRGPTAGTSVAGGAPNASGGPQPQPGPGPQGDQPRPPETGLPGLCGGVPGG